MKKPTIYRKRIVPNEVVDISGDILLFRNQDLIITQWNTIKPRDDIAWGISYAFLKEGYKISRVYDKLDEFKYWYVDIIHIDYDQKADEYVFLDLLLDFKKIPEKEYEILDMEELAEAINKGLVSNELACEALRITDNILKMYYLGEFPPKVCFDKRFLEKNVEL